MKGTVRLLDHRVWVHPQHTPKVIFYRYSIDFSKYNDDSTFTFRITLYAEIIRFSSTKLFEL